MIILTHQQDHLQTPDLIWPLEFVQLRSKCKAKDLQVQFGHGRWCVLTVLVLVRSSLELRVLRLECLEVRLPCEQVTTSMKYSIKLTTTSCRSGTGSRSSRKRLPFPFRHNSGIYATFERHSSRPKDGLLRIELDLSHQSLPTSSRRRRPPTTSTLPTTVISAGFRRGPCRQSQIRSSRIFCGMRLFVVSSCFSEVGGKRFVYQRQIDRRPSSSLIMCRKASTIVLLATASYQHQ